MSSARCSSCPWSTWTRSCRSRCRRRSACARSSGVGVTAHALLTRAHSYLTPKAVLGPSPLGGLGLLARAPIRRHELVAIWGNRVMTTAELWALPERLRDFPVQIWYDMFIGPMSEDEIEPVDYMNHSCEPNCGVRGSVVVVARRDIQPGEELTFDTAPLIPTAGRSSAAVVPGSAAAASPATTGAS